MIHAKSQREKISSPRLSVLARKKNDSRKAAKPQREKIISPRLSVLARKKNRIINY